MSQDNPNRDAALAEIADATGADPPSAPAAPAAIIAAGGVPNNAETDPLRNVHPAAVQTGETIGSGSTTMGKDIAAGGAAFVNKVFVQGGENLGQAIVATATTVGNAIVNAPAAIGAAARGVDRPSSPQPGLTPPTTAAVEAPPDAHDEPEAGPGAAATPQG